MKNCAGLDFFKFQLTPCLYLPTVQCVTLSVAVCVFGLQILDIGRTNSICICILRGKRYLLHSDVVTGRGDDAALEDTYQIKFNGLVVWTKLRQCFKYRKKTSLSQCIKKIENSSYLYFCTFA